MTVPRIPIVSLVVVVLATAAALIFATPRPAELSEHTSGDPGLAERLRHLADDRGHQSLAAVEITPDTITHAAIGEAAPGSGEPIQPETPIELGSITKTFNGHLLADAVERGEVSVDDSLKLHLPSLSGTPVGDVTLEELATHRGGVPRLPTSVAMEGLLTLLNGDNPYADATKNEILAEVENVELSASRGEMEYSNLGAALLGWALADAAGAPTWDAYAQQRLLEPLGIDVVFAAAQSDVPGGTAPAFTTNGFRPEHWVSPGMQPTGAATYMAPAAVGAYAQAILTDRVPGMEALEPRVDIGPGEQIGLHWMMTTTTEDRSVTWHNGGTGGYRTFLAFDRAADHAVFVVGNTDASVDGVALALLTDADEAPETDGPWWLLVLAPAIAALLVAAALWSALRQKDRPSIIAGLAGAVFAVTIARYLGGWATLGAWAWMGLVIVTAVAAVLAAARWPHLPWKPRRFAVFNWLNAAGGIALVVGVLWLSL